MSRRILVATASALVACGGSSTSKDSSALDFCNTAAELSARRSNECARVAPELTAYLISAYEASGACAAVQESVSAGRAGFDRAKADACVAAIGAASCDMSGYFEYSHPSDAECAGVFTGTLAPGAACRNAFECANGVCMQASSSSGSPICPGTCVAYLTAGQECGLSAIAAGTTTCAPGLLCVPDASLVNRCQAFTALAVGEACGAGGFCGPGLYCNTSSMTCVAQQTSGPCTYSCSSPVDCAPGEVCGTMCLAGNECAAGTACTPDASGTTAQCMQIVLPGGSCAAGQPCALGTHCDGATCVLNPVVGEPCSTGFCIGGYCDGTTCRAPKPDGSSCVPGECGMHSSCTNSVCESFVCR
jgi:hypothetical protein